RGKLIQWDAGTGLERGRTAVAPEQFPPGEELTGAVSGEGNVVALTPKRDGPVEVWNLVPRRRLLRLDHNPRPADLVATSPTTARMTRGGRLVDWDVRTGRLIRSWPLPEDPRQRDAMLHPVRKTSHAHDEDAEHVVVSDAATGQELYRVGP